jgi:SIR2-like domain
LSLREADWEDLLKAVKRRQCTPFIGAGASVPWVPLGSEIAYEWAKEYGYPLEDSSQLARVTQFMGIDRGWEMFPKNELSEKLAKINPADFSDVRNKNTPHAVLASLNLPVYITTNYDKFMEAALVSQRKDPDTEYCRWNQAIEFAGVSSVFDNPEYRPSEYKPLVYHIHGTIDVPQSMVLTERDYIDFIINLSKDEKLLPTLIRKALAATSLLFIGYSLEDINFRIIFQGIMSIVKSPFQLPSIAVQLPPSLTKDDGFSEAKREKALRYLDDYTKNMFKVRVYWGDAKEFAEELHRRWEGYN